jgi:anthranilate synthase component 1
MNLEQFRQFAEQGYSRIPVHRAVLADLDTPLSTYLKLAAGPHSYLFESVHGGEKWGRYSIIGLPCRTVVKVTGHQVLVHQDGLPVEQAEVGDPLAWLDDYRRRYRVPEFGGNLPRFVGGLVGYFGYDTVRYVEPRLGECPNPDGLGCPDILLMLSEEVLVFDNLAGKLYVICLLDPAHEHAWERGQARLDELVRQLREGRIEPHATRDRAAVEEEHFVSGFTREHYQAAVERIREYIIAGDVMQVVLSQRLSVPLKADPLDLYRALRTLNPSPYMYYLDLDDFHIVGSSPEILVRLEEGEVTVRPIAGTRHRGATAEEDRALEQDLLADPKELAEHLMLIDLGRNDVGRVAEIGSVRVNEQMAVERYSHVMHIVSNVVGKLRPELGPVDVLRATFPAGTLSGAPKIRAMEIIDELEPVKRGVYGGAVGYLSWTGTMDTAIAIRTAVIKDGVLHIQAGAGIVADSVPESEWQETMDKGRAMFRAVAMAEKGLA